MCMFTKLPESHMLTRINNAQSPNNNNTKKKEEEEQQHLTTMFSSLNRESSVGTVETECSERSTLVQGTKGVPPVLIVPSILVPNKEMTTRTIVNKKKSVRFSRLARARRVSSWRNFSPEELDATWYSPDEYKEIRQSCCRDIQNLDRGKECVCSRGLESRTKLGRTTRTEHKFESIKAVLDEQDAQWDANGNHADTKFDVEAIAAVYRQATGSSQALASAAGLADWHAIGDEEEEEEEHCYYYSSAVVVTTTTRRATKKEKPNLSSSTTKLVPSPTCNQHSPYAAMA